MRLLFWSIVLSILLILGFAELAAPIAQQHKQPPHTLPIHKTLYLERSVDDDEMLHILQGALEWNEVTNGQVIFDIKKLPQRNIMPLDAIIVYNVTPDYPDIILLDAVKKYSTLGYFNNDRGLDYIALVEKRISQRDFTPVIMHELGHALGLQHPDTEDHPEIGIGSLMHSTIDEGSNHITDLDLKQLCQLYHCDASKFHGIP
jgi:hypothetical protein